MTKLEVLKLLEILFRHSTRPVYGNETGEEYLDCDRLLGMVFTMISEEEEVVING